MTTTALEDADLGSALTMRWQRHRQTNLDRISLLEATTANVLRKDIDDDALAEGAGAAHKLAGSLGTFGFDAGSRAALDAEFLLREPLIDGRLLAEAVTALRSSVEEGSEYSGAGSDPETHHDETPNGSAAIQVVSFDTGLISRLTVEAAAVGLAIASTTEMPPAGPFKIGPPSLVVVDDDAARPWTRPQMLVSVAELARRTQVIVLTDRETFEDRVELAKAGTAGVIPRSQGAHQVVAFLAETLAQQTPAHSTVLTLNAGAGLLDALAHTLGPPVPRDLRHCLELLGCARSTGCGPRPSRSGWAPGERVRAHPGDPSTPTLASRPGHHRRWARPCSSRRGDGRWG